MTSENINRIIELESKFIFQEDSIERLSKELRLQQLELIRLKEEVKHLMSLLEDPAVGEAETDTKPPHY
jgi:uncharacterized coiled-coil protein SlyX